MTAMRHARSCSLVLGLLMSVLSGACGGSSPASPGATTVGVQGTWGGGSLEQGTYRIAACANSGGIATQGNFCNQVSIGTTASVGMVLTQSGASVSGTMFFGTYSIPVTGTFDGTTLVLGGTTPYTVAGFSTPGTFTMAGWSTTDSNGALSGSFAIEVTVSGVSGIGILTCQVVTLAKS